MSRLEHNRRYYEQQNSIIDKYGNVLDPKEQILDQRIIKLKKRVQILTTISLAINICLFFMKIIALVLSDSLSIISSVIDSAVDLVSSIILFWTPHAIRNRNQYRYPAGRTRLEPVAIMCSASVQVLSEAIKRSFAYIRYITNYTKEIPEVNIDIKQPFPIIVMCITIVLKAILYYCCHGVPVETIKALAHDHRNDVLSNCIVHIRHLTGVTADSDFLKLMTWIAINFTPSHTKIDMIKAFHFGTDLLVEVDIILPGNMQIQETHDIGINLQIKLESLPEIERAFVHIDYEFQHKTDEHKQI